VRILYLVSGRRSGKVEPCRSISVPRTAAIGASPSHADIPDIVWADDETGCYGVRGRDARGKEIVVERSGPIRIVTARK